MCYGRVRAAALENSLTHSVVCGEVNSGNICPIKSTVESKDKKKKADAVCLVFF